jgi:VCBS repeat-containing protein
MVSFITNEDSKITITLNELNNYCLSGNYVSSATDAYIIEGISRDTYTLTLGLTEELAEAFDLSYNEIDASNNAYWTPSINYIGSTYTFSVYTISDPSNKILIPIVVNPIRGEVTEDVSGQMIIYGKLTNVTNALSWHFSNNSLSKYGTYGTVTILDNSGNWRYDLSNNSLIVQLLKNGDRVTDTFIATIGDGLTADTSQQIVITINGMDDFFTDITGDISRNIWEDGSSNYVTGTLSSTNVGNILIWDLSGVNTVQSNYGTMHLDSSGTSGVWRYDISNNSSYVQELAAGKKIIETYTAKVTNGLSSKFQEITITINGTNDAPTAITGDTSGNIWEDGTPSFITGTLLSTDVDISNNLTWDLSGVKTVQSNYGMMHLDSSGTSGVWIYDISNNSPYVQALAAGEQIIETYTAKVTDGSYNKFQQITITINGANDEPTSITGDTSGNIWEDGTSSYITGTLFSTDVDLSNILVWDLSGVKSVQSNYGTMRLDSSGTSGVWRYDISNNSSYVQALSAGQTKIETYTAKVTDGLSSKFQQITITINGANDEPTAITGDISGNIWEDGSPSYITGTLLSTDVDISNNLTWDLSGSKTAQSNYGTMHLDSSGTSGVWQYDISINSSYVQALAAGEQIIETYTAKVTDGLSSKYQTITITINGTNDEPTAITGDTSGNIWEDGTPNFITGTLFTSDVDISNNLTWDLSGIKIVQGKYGTMRIDTSGNRGLKGIWRYDISNNSINVMTLKQNEHVTDEFTCRVYDGTVYKTKDIIINITGKNTPPIIIQQISDQIVYQNTAFNYTIPDLSTLFTDYDADTSDNLTYTITFNDSTPVNDKWLLYDNVTHTFSGNPGFSYVEKIPVIITARDKYDASANLLFNIRTNQPPSLNTIASFTVNEDTPLEITFQSLLTHSDAVDNDGSIMAFKITTLNYHAGVIKIGDISSNVLIYDSSTNNIIDVNHTAYWTPLPDINGIFNAFSVVAIDNLNAISLNTVPVNIYVTPVNDAPAIVTNTILTTQTIITNTLFNYTFPSGLFTDVDIGDILTYRVTRGDGISPIPSWLQFNKDTMTLSGTPQINDIGSISIRITATDTSYASVNITFNIIVTPHPPYVPVITSQTVNNEQVTIFFNSPINTGISFTDYEYSIDYDETWTSFNIDATSTNNSLTISNLINNISYNVRLRAINSQKVISNLTNTETIYSSNYSSESQSITVIPYPQTTNSNTNTEIPRETFMARMLTVTNKFSSKKYINGPAGTIQSVPFRIISGNPHIVHENDYFYILFTDNCNIEFLKYFSPENDFTAVVVGGGGGGGLGGGGGAGGSVIIENTSVNPKTIYNVTVGSGGVGESISQFASDGSLSRFSSITSQGGAAGYSATSGQGGIGSNGGGNGGNGGNIISIPEINGSNGTSIVINLVTTYYGGGGGGNGIGGLGGGGGGGFNFIDGLPNTGGGGGGGLGGNGGSGIVIIYFKYIPVVEYPVYNYVQDINKKVANSSGDVDQTLTQSQRAVNAIKYSTGGRVVYGNSATTSNRLNFLGRTEGQPGGIMGPVRNRF